VAEIIKLTCPACGAKLELTEDIERFACSYCGNEHIVIRRGGLVTLKPVVEQLEGVRVATDKTASELALVRLEKEIEEAKGRLDKLQSPRALLGCAGLGLLMLLVSIPEIGEGQDLTCVAISLVILVGSLVGFFLTAGPKSKERREIELLLKAKREEYRKHQEIVEER